MNTTEFEELFAREHSLVMEARHADVVRKRWAIVFIALGLAVFGWWTEAIHLTVGLALGLAAVTSLANAAASWLLASGRFASWQFWGMIGVDTLLIAGFTAALGPHGYLTLVVVVFVIAGYALGMPEASQIQVALAGVAYPAGRVLGFGMLGESAPMGLIGTEALFGIGAAWLGTLGAIDFTRRLRRARTALAQIERGDFSLRLADERLDDIGFLSVSVNSMLETLGTTVLDIQAQARSLTEMAESMTATAQDLQQSAEDIGTATGSLADEATQQMRLADEGQNAVELVARSSHKLRDDAAASAEAARRRSGDAGANADRIEEAGSMLVELGDEFKESAAAMDDLTEAGERIDGFVNTIHEIARQTNLLALNAAIEAARAGEYGRGFAVVADEVHKLADESDASADDVAGTVDNVNEAIVELKRRLSKSNARISGVEEVAGSGHAALESMVEGLGETVEVIQDMAVGIEQQVVAIETIEANMRRLKELASSAMDRSQSNAAATEEQIASMEEMTANVEQLADMAVHLNRIVDRFKVPEQSVDGLSERLTVEFRVDRSDESEPAESAELSDAALQEADTREFA